MIQLIGAEPAHELTTDEAARVYFGGSRRKLERAVEADWFHASSGGGKSGGAAFYWRTDLDEALRRRKAGEEPPLLPSEQAQKARRANKGDAR